MEIVEKRGGKFFERVFVRLPRGGRLFCGGLGTVDDDYGRVEIQNI